MIVVFGVMAAFLLWGVVAVLFSWLVPTESERARRDQVERERETARRRARVRVPASEPRGR